MWTKDLVLWSVSAKQVKVFRILKTLPLCSELASAGSAAMVAGGLVGNKQSSAPDCSNDITDWNAIRDFADGIFKTAKPLILMLCFPKH